MRLVFLAMAARMRVCLTSSSPGLRAPAGAGAAGAGLGAAGAGAAALVPAAATVQARCRGWRSAVTLAGRREGGLDLDFLALGAAGGGAEHVVLGQRAERATGGDFGQVDVEVGGGAAHDQGGLVGEVAGQRRRVQRLGRARAPAASPGPLPA